MPVILLASFPNSRIKPRKATSNASVVQVSCPALSATLVKSPNPNRTYATVENTSDTETIFYGYVGTLTDLVSSQSLSPLEADDLETLGEIWIYNPNAGAVIVSVDEGEG